MDTYQTEEQRVETIKRFWHNNNKLIIICLLLFSSGYFGFKYYKHHKEVVAESASLQYGKMVDAINNKDTTASKNFANELMDKYKNTPYSELAALKLAKLAMDNLETEEARNKLTWILENKSRGPVLHIAIIRLARIYREQGNYAKALEILDRNSNGFAALYDEVRGDIYADQKDLVKAKEFYKKSLKNSPKSGATPWLQLKLENLSGVGNVESKI